MATSKPYYEHAGITLHCGDNVQTMREMIPDASVDLVVTSPPYDNLRTYGGHSWDFEGVAAELWRVIKLGGVVVWVVADATVNGSETGTSFRQALHFKELGFRLHDTMIYKKAGFSPNTHHPRYNHCFEYMFIFSSGAPKSWTPARKRRNTTAGTKWNPKTKTQRNGKLCRFNVAESVTPEETTDVNVWEFLVGGASGDEGVDGHPAIFPESLARDHILSWSNEGDTVLDPFSGSGTTMKMARLMGRKGIGIEIHQEYCEIAVRRLAQGVLF